MIRALALALTVVTGATGLVYEVAWQKYLAILLGSHGEATAAVLAIFLGGLSLGYAGFGRISARLVARARALGREPRLLVTYGCVEAGIGAYAFVFPLLFGAARAVSTRVPFEAAGPAFVFDVGLAALLIGPPSVLMGGTIPLLTQGLARSLEDATRLHARVYAFNTAGAFVGALAAGFWLVPRLGLVGVVHSVGWLNVIAGAVFVVAGWSPAAAARQEAVADDPPVAGLHRYAWVALLVGFAMMTVQVVFIRIGGLSLGSSHFTFAMVVAVFVLCIALGSLAVSALPRIPRLAIAANLWALVATLALLYPLLADGPYWAHALRSLFRDHSAGFHPFYANAFAGLLVVLGPAVMLSGAALPLLFDHLRDRVGDLGAVAGRLYSWNTVGSLVGALLGGYWLLYWLDLHAVYRLAIAAVAVAALLASRIVLGRHHLAAVALGCASAAVLLALPPWAPERLASGTFRFRAPQPGTFGGADDYFREHVAIEVPFYDDDPAVSVAVIDHPVAGGTDRSLAIVTNGKPDGDIATDYTTMSLAALLPAVLAERVERAFVIGYGTGVTVGEMAAIDSVREVVVAEISSGVLAAAPWFDPWNQAASSNPKVHAIRGDAYRALLRGRGRWDIIASEPSNPWVTGTEMLYSREFLESARDRLAPGGVYVQWYHSYETSSETVALVLSTFRSVFPSVAIWYATGPDLLLVGFAEPGARPSLDRVAQRTRDPSIAAGLSRSGIDHLAALLAHELVPAGVVSTLDLGDDVHTLLHPLLSDRAARAFFRGGQGVLPSSGHRRAAAAGADASLVRQLAARNGGQLRDRAREAFVAETCEYRPDECAVVLAEWLHDDALSTARIAAEREARRRPGFQRALRAPALRALADLFDADAVDGRDAVVTPQLAGAASENFARFYHHAAPFDRRVLDRLWSACERNPAQRDACRRGRAAAEARLGPLG